MAERIYPSTKPNSNPPQTLNGNANGNGNGNANPTFPPSKAQLYGASRPTYRPQPKRHRRSCCCCFLWSIFIIVILLVIAAIAGAVLYSIYQPKRPNFSLTTLKITQFNITSNEDEGSSNLNSKLDLTIQAKNPNKEVVFFYNPINITVSTNGVDIGDGSIPSFIHGTKNTTLLRASVTSSPSLILDPATAKSLRDDLKNKKNGVPLKIELNTKVKVKMGSFKTKKVGIEITCDRIRAVPVTVTVPIKGKGKTNSTSTSTVWKFPESSVANCKVNLKIKIWKWTF